MRYWWVNQNQTYRAEARGGFMWSPKQNANGARNQFYENMRQVSPGDVVFSFCDTRIKAVGVVTGGAKPAPSPTSAPPVRTDPRRLVRLRRLLRPEQSDPSKGSRGDSSSVSAGEILATPESGDG